MAIRFMRCTDATKSASTTVLESGQPLYNTNTSELFIGDGQTQVKDLISITPYAAGTGFGSVISKYSVNLGPVGSSGVGSASYKAEATGRNAAALTARAKAQGDSSIAAGWAATAYTKADIALGVSSQAGLKESEFNSFYPDPDGYVVASNSDISKESHPEWFKDKYRTSSSSPNSTYDYYLTYEGFKNLVSNGSVAFSQGKARGLLTIAGLGAITDGTYNFGIGKNVTVAGTNNIGLGVGIEITEDIANQTVIGRYNAPDNNASIIFAVGNSSERKNGMVIAPQKIVAHLPTSVWNTFRASEIRSASSEMSGAANKIIFGSACESLANNTFVGGYGCNVENSAHERSILYGLDLRSSGANSAVFGKYNNPDTNIMFMVGAGTSSGARYNALEVHFNGQVKVNKTPTIYEGSTDVIRGNEIAQLTYSQPINSTAEYDGVITEVTQRAGKIAVKKAHRITQLSITTDATITSNSQGVVRGQQLYREQQARSNADTQLTNALEAEKTTRASADSALDSKIEAETTRATQAETVLTNKINNEKSERVYADKYKTSTVIRYSAPYSPSAGYNANETSVNNIKEFDSFCIMCNNAVSAPIYYIDSKFITHSGTISTSTMSNGRTKYTITVGSATIGWYVYNGACYFDGPTTLDSGYYKYPYKVLSLQQTAYTTY